MLNRLSRALPSLKTAQASSKSTPTPTLNQNTSSPFFYTIPPKPWTKSSTHPLHSSPTHHHSSIRTISQCTKSSSQIISTHVHQNTPPLFTGKFPSQKKPLIYLVGIGGVSSVPGIGYDPVREIHKEDTPALGNIISFEKELAKEKTLDEWLEADAVLKLNHIRRRAILEEQAINDQRQAMSYQDRKMQELKHQDMLDNGVYVPYETTSTATSTNFADSLNNEFASTTENGLTPQEQKVLQKWLQDRDSHNVVINYLTDDIANYLKSFLIDDITIVFDTFLEYFPKLIPHYFITPYIINFVTSFIPTALHHFSHNVRDILVPSIFIRPFRFATSVFRSGNVMVDMRCLYNFTIIITTSISYLTYQLTTRFPQIYKYCGKYLLYPLGWFLHHYGDSELVTHIIRCSMKHEEHVRIRNYENKYGISPSPTHSIPSSTLTPPSQHRDIYNESLANSNARVISTTSGSKSNELLATNTMSTRNLLPTQPRTSTPALSLTPQSNYTASEQPTSFINPINPTQTTDNVGQLTPGW